MFDRGKHRLFSLGPVPRVQRGRLRRVFMLNRWFSAHGKRIKSLDFFYVSQ
jgi:hypothetical protein